MAKDYAFKLRASSVAVSLDKTTMDFKVDPKARQTGAVIVFNKGVTPEQANRLLEQFTERLKLATVQVREFNPTYGYPVFYVP